MTREELLQKAKTAIRESKYIDFKEEFDVNSNRDWCEIIKDIAAMANSGGGAILVGIKNDGKPSGFDVTPLLQLDSAKISDKLYRYTGENVSDVDIIEARRNRHKIAVLYVPGGQPLVFTQPGTYDIGSGKQKTAFGKGTVYFRHGAKSEPGNTNDIKKVIERELESVRKSWLSKVRKVMQAPKGYHVQMLPPHVIETMALLGRRLD